MKEDKTKMTSEELTQGLRDLAGSFVMNRHERRALNKKQRALGRISVDIESLVPADQLLEQENDVPLLEHQLKSYQIAQRQNRRDVEIYAILREGKIPDSACRTILLDPGLLNQGNKLALPNFNMSPATANRILQTSRSLSKEVLSTTQYHDEDDEEIRHVLADSDIPIKDILHERIRYRQETIDLIKMQLDWLKTHPFPSETQVLVPEEENEVQVFPSQTQTAAREQVKEPFLLSEWKLFWTDVPWSTEGQHLREIPTSTRLETVKALQQVAKGEISIKPKSVVRALEFYLQQDVLQRAMAARLKYVQPEVREWIKIKRGNDRIPVRVINDKEAIFFAGGRDKIYESLRRK